MTPFLLDVFIGIGNVNFEANPCIFDCIGGETGRVLIELIVPMKKIDSHEVLKR